MKLVIYKLDLTCNSYPGWGFGSIPILYELGGQTPKIKLRNIEYTPCDVHELYPITKGLIPG